MTMITPGKILFAGTSNTIIAKDIITRNFPSASIFALGDATSSILIEATSNQGIKSNLSGKYHQCLVVDTLPNEFAFYYSGKIPISALEETWTCCADIIKKINYEYVCLLDLFPKQFNSNERAYSFAMHRLQFIRAKLSKDVPVYQYAIEADSDYIDGSDDGYHFTLDDYTKIYKGLRIAASSFLDQATAGKSVAAEERFTHERLEVIKQNHVLSLANNIWTHADIKLSHRMSTFSNSLHTCRGIYLGVDEALELQNDSPMPPSYIVFKSTQTVKYITIKFAHKTWHINTKTSTLPGKIIRCVNICDSLGHGLASQNISHGKVASSLIVSIQQSVEEGSIEVYHSNADNTESSAISDPIAHNEGVLIFSIGWTNSISKGTVQLYPQPKPYTKIEPNVPSDNYPHPKNIYTKKELEIYFDSFWPSFDPRHTIFNELLLKPSGATITSDIKSADLVLTSVFCNDFDLSRNFTRLKELSTAPILFYTGEHTNCKLGGRVQVENGRTPYDYILSHYISFKANMFWLPNYALGGSSIFSKVNNLWNNNRLCIDRQGSAVFCYSNPGQNYRNKIAEELDRRGVLHSCGPLMNNTVTMAPRDLQEYGRYISNFRVVLAIENSSGPCYTTEKLTNSLCGGTQVVYWGDPLAQQVVNPKSFHQISDYSFSEAIDLIMQLLRIDLPLDPDMAPFENPEYFEQLIKYGFEQIRQYVF